MVIEIEPAANYTSGKVGGQCRCSIALPEPCATDVSGLTLRSRLNPETLVQRQTNPFAI